MGHKVINCQLPDGLKPEENILEMSLVTLSLFRPHGGDGGAQAADGGPQVVWVDVAHAHVVWSLLLWLGLRSGVDVDKESLTQIKKCLNVLYFDFLIF